MRNFLQALKKKDQIRKLDHTLHKISCILDSSSEPITKRAELDFANLQAAYQPVPEYGYDPLSIYRRASDRSCELLSIPSLRQPGLRGLDLGAGDGMLSVLLNAFGHSMTLCDINDWRVASAKPLAFKQVDCCGQIPLKSEDYDFVISYNTFEHFSDPEAALKEILRILRPGGLMFTQFNPLYCSPWGLHAYRSLRMPYPQFLFSDSFIDERLKESGISDLGSERNELQYLNKWRPSQYESLWRTSSAKLVTLTWHVNSDHVEMVQKYPEAFQGRNLVYDDLVRAGITVLLEKQ
jgi:SAM-dependent methyltransferase